MISALAASAPSQELVYYSCGCLSHKGFVGIEHLAGPLKKFCTTVFSLHTQFCPIFQCHVSYLSANTEVVVS